MRNWYVYYRLLHALHHRDRGAHRARLELQDVLAEMRSRALREWPDAAEQEIQDFYEHLANNPDLFTEPQARHLTLMEPWADEEVINVQPSK